MTTRVAAVKLLTRPGCEACDRGRFILRRLKYHATFTASVVNILKHQEAYMKYSEELPVILVEEEAICRGKIVERDLKRAIEEFNRS